MDELIYNQTKIPKEQWRYGFRSSAATGCGWIAVYNALRLLGYRAKPEGLIRYFERQLPLIHGNAGTSIWGPWAYFRKWGFPAKMSARRRVFDALAEKADVCVLFFRWRRGWRFGAHFVALRWNGAEFVGYNTFRSSQGPDSYGPSLDAFLRKNGYFGAVLTYVRDKRTGQ
ncbi:MAG: hypothetical protein IKC09_09685 [Oscillospiraceae bacterium]|nr:hypothetical protein [Oscillospiraceae bacterium]